MAPRRIVYLSFDRFPSPKGAATHIDAFVSTLGRTFGGVDLITVASQAVQPAWRPFSTSRDEAPADRDPSPWSAWQAEGVVHHPLPLLGSHLFERVIHFRSQIWNWWKQRFTNPAHAPLVHFRSIFEGYPIARHKERFCKQLVFEVNGLPSIELKYRYPNVAEDPELLNKLKVQEQVCLEAADLILTVSRTNREHLQQRGVPPQRIRVIPNGVDLSLFSSPSPKPALLGNPEMRMLYAGTMSAWQGVSIAIEALALYCRDYPARLTLVGPVRSHQRRDLLQQAWQLGVADRVSLLDAVPKSELATLHREADVIVAPLMANDRNLVQGCCPLKVLEAMASGTPLIASDLPVVRELATNNSEALLVRPGSGKAIKDGMLRLRSEWNLANRLGTSARTRVEREFCWSRAQNALIESYQELMD